MGIFIFPHRCISSNYHNAGYIVSARGIFVGWLIEWIRCYSVPCKIKSRVLSSLPPIFHDQQGDTYKQGHKLSFICLAKSYGKTSRMSRRQSELPGIRDFLQQFSLTCYFRPCPLKITSSPSKCQNALCAARIPAAGHSKPTHLQVPFTLNSCLKIIRLLNCRRITHNLNSSAKWHMDV